MLSPRFIRAYTFGSFALVDAGRPDLGARLLERGFEANPNEWVLPSLRAFFAYQYGAGDEKANLREAAYWYQRAAEVPGSPASQERLAAVLMAKGGAAQKAMLMWGQVYAEGDKYSKPKAVDGIYALLSSDAAARSRQLQALRDTLSSADYEALVRDLAARAQAGG